MFNDLKLIKKFLFLIIIIFYYNIINWQLDYIISYLTQFYIYLKV